MYNPWFCSVEHPSTKWTRVTIRIPDSALNFNADPERAFHFNADPEPDPDPAPHQSDGNLRPLVYRPYRAFQNKRSRPYKALFEPQKLLRIRIQLFTLMRIRNRHPGPNALPMVLPEASVPRLSASWMASMSRRGIQHSENHISWHFFYLSFRGHHIFC